MNPLAVRFGHIVPEPVPAGQTLSVGVGDRHLGLVRSPDFADRLVARRRAEGQREYQQHSHREVSKLCLAMVLARVARASTLARGRSWFPTGMSTCPCH